ncbi:hypothetical protein SAMN05660199_00794 [Klenkia soli]|uniref:Uncharacterized protein n=1 Tax=Klenkia soli TaxID=1052260 RepID=A0A1H0ELZ5_9ACTN|nr:hypothetical protein [Klenkia soli]SDN83477.1 hypothetical protein SAMN05660199_00794 [Klenkia soli]
MPLKLPVASVVALLGPAAVRAQVCAALDEGSARCAGGHGGLRVARIGVEPGDPLQDRLDVVRAAGQARIVLVERLTAGLGSADRRVVLSALEDLAGAGATVVVDDDDPVAVLAVADAALRVDATGQVELEELPDLTALLAG